MTDNGTTTADRITPSLPDESGALFQHFTELVIDIFMAKQTGRQMLIQSAEMRAQKFANEHEITKREQ